MPIYIGSLGSGFINSFLAARRLRMQQEWYHVMADYYRSIMNKQGGAQGAFDTGSGAYGGGKWGTGDAGGSGFERLKQNIGQFESGGDYGITNTKTGALGKYQVMPANLGPWTREALGHEMTADEFLKDHNAQEQVADYKMRQYYQQHGNLKDVASMWFTGKPYAEGQFAKPDAMGTTPVKYVSTVMNGVDDTGQAPASGPVASETVGGKPTETAGGKNPYSLINDVDDQGRPGQIAKFKQWNNDPIGNSAKNLASVHPDLQKIVNRAQQDNPDLKFVVAYGKGTPEQEKQAKEWGWSQTDKSNHLKGTVVDLWPIDKDGNVNFDKGQQKQISDAMNKAAGELGLKVRWGGLQSEGGANKGFRDAPNFELENPRILSKGEQAKLKAATPTVKSTKAPEPAPTPKPAEASKPAETPTPKPAPTTDSGVATAQAQQFKSYQVAGPMEPPPTQSTQLTQTGDVRSPPHADPYWVPNPPLSSLQKVQQQTQPTPAQGIPAPKQPDTAQPAQPTAKVPDEPKVKIQDQTQAKQGIPPPPAPPSGGGEEVPQDTRLVLPDMPQSQPITPTVDPFQGQIAQGMPPSPTGQPLIRPQQPPQSAPDQSEDDSGDILASAKGGPVLRFERGGMVQKFQWGGQAQQSAALEAANAARPPTYWPTAAQSALRTNVTNQMQSLVPMNPNSDIWSEVNALTPAQQQWYIQAGQAMQQSNAAPAYDWSNIFSGLGTPPSATPAATPAAATPAPTVATATPTNVQPTVTPAQTAVNVPGGSTPGSQASTGLIPWVKGQSGTITAPNTTAKTANFGQPTGNTSDYNFTNTQNPSGTGYNVNEYGYLTNEAGYQYGGDVSPASLGPPPGMPMGGQGQPPIPPVYYNSATFSPYGAGVGKGVSYASAPTLVAQGIPTYQYGGDVGGDPEGSQIDQDIAQQIRYTPTSDQSTTDSGGTEPIQVASIDSGVHIPSISAGGGGMGMRGPTMRRPPLPRQTIKGQDEGIPGSRAVEDVAQPPPRPQGAPPEAPMITDGQGNPSYGVTSAIAGALHFLGNAMGLGPGQSNGALATDPNIQANRRQFMSGDMPEGMHEAVLNTVDPDQALDNGMRNLAGLEAVYKYYMLNSNPDAANRTAASMLMYARQLASKYGDQAIAHYKSGDINSAIDALSKADDYIPNGLKLSGKLDPASGQVDVEQRDLNNKLIWKQQVAPQAILAAAIGVKNGQFFWGQLETAAAKYDPVTAQMIEQKKIDQQAAALESAGKAMGGGTGGSGGLPSGEPGQGGNTQPIRWKIPGQNAPVQANAASPQTPQPGPPVAANAPPTTGSGAGPVIPNAPTGQSIPPPANLSPVVAQQNAQPVAPGASPADSGTAPSPDGTASAVAQQPKSIDPNAPSPQAQDVSEEQEQSVYADIAAQAHSYNFTKDGVPLINGQPFARPVEPSYAGMDKDTAARVKEMYKERLADYNSAVKFASSNEREMINSANRDASADITERRMRYRSEQSDLRQRTTMEQQEKLQTERMTQQEKMQTEREKFSQQQQTDRQKFAEGQANQRVVLQSQLNDHNEDYKDNLKNTDPLKPEEVNRGLTGNPDASPTDRYTAILGLLASAADPNVQGGRSADAQVTLQNKGFQRDQQEFLARTFENSYTHSPHVDPRSVAQGILSAANGEHTVFTPERADKDGKPVAGPNGVRYAVTVDTPTGAISFTMKGDDLIPIMKLGTANAQARTQKTIAPVTSGSQFTPFSQTGIPSRPTPWQPPKPPPPQSTMAKPLVQVPPNERQRFAIPPRVPNAQVPQEWKDQFPELNQ